MRQFLFMLALVGLAAGLLTVSPVQAFPDECYNEVIERTEIVNPFTGTVTIIEEVKRDLKSECETVQDGRENPQHPSATVAIYCTDIGIDVYYMDISGRGTFAFRATQAEIDAVPVNPAQNTQIDGAPGVALYRLTDGKMQVNAPPDWEGKPYIYIWDGC